MAYTNQHKQAVNYINNSDRSESLARTYGKLASNIYLFHTFILPYSGSFYLGYNLKKAINDKQLG